MNVGAYRNYPYWRAPKVWGHAVRLALVAFLLGMLAMCSMVQKHPGHDPKPTVTVTDKHVTRHGKPLGNQ